MKIHTLILFMLIIAPACNTSRKTTSAPEQAPESGKKRLPETTIYHASNTRSHDLLHTKLEVSFSTEKKQLYGKAILLLTPYFYPSSILTLNARGMDLHEVCLLQKGGNKLPLKYNYANDSLSITLDRTYLKGEHFNIFIDYTARPEDLKDEGGTAITSNKGLYFINADGKDPEMPRQIWTQGETQSSSAWFPTIDSPNERMTQELYITVDTAFKTLSNGLLLSSVVNKDGSRTDYWKQSLPAAPYLTMMAIGKYSVVKDQWRNMEVSYYVEPEYEAYAKLIFGNTPQMLEFYSGRLKTDYPWEKFSQVVVREYVSGAMENTTAVIHGEFMQQDSRELLDNSHEDVIAHELFHHWFGDLVTCESWSNIPLNESFATYGEYLWNEFKYGRDAADFGLQQNLTEYLMLGRNSNIDLIRFDYKNRDDMFNAVSYQKGGHILHMLRKAVGDDAFFESLRCYLETNRFKSVEAHQLRLAFEEVTGIDLNWFFNQWFFSGGHPELKISYAYNDSLHRQFIYTEQNQDIENTPLYKIPVSVDLYINGNSIRKQIWLSQARDTFSFDLEMKPSLVNFDAEKMLLAVKNDIHSTAEYIFMYRHAPLYLDRYEALNRLSKNYTASGEQASVVKAALGDKFHNLRILAIRNIGPLAQDEKSGDEIKKILISLAENDSVAGVRSAALRCLSKYYKGENMKELYHKAAGDSSYEVMSEAIKNYVREDPSGGLQWLRQFETSENSHVSKVIAGIYAGEGSDENNAYFIRIMSKSKGFTKYQLVSDYSKFLTRCKPATIETSLPVMEDVAVKANGWWVRMSGTQALADLLKYCQEKSESLTNLITEAVKAGKSSIEIQVLESEKKKFDELKENIEQRLDHIRKNETDKNLKKIYGHTGD